MHASSVRPEIRTTNQTSAGMLSQANGSSQTESSTTNPSRLPTTNHLISNGRISSSFPKPMQIRTQILQEMGLPISKNSPSESIRIRQSPLLHSSRKMETT